MTDAYHRGVPRRVVYSCVRCGMPFEMTRPNRKYCDSCKSNHHNKRDLYRAGRQVGMPVDIDGAAQPVHEISPSSPLAAWCGRCQTRVDWDGGTVCPACGTPWPRRRASKRVRLQVAERDGWICHRCSKPIDPGLPYGHPLALVADHFPVSISDGGPAIPANLKAAHSLCNGSHLGLGTMPQETIDSLISAGLMQRESDGASRYSLTPEGHRIIEEAKRSKNRDPLAVTLIRAVHRRDPHWWDKISDSERALAAEIMKLPIDRTGGVLPPPPSIGSTR